MQQDIEIYKIGLDVGSTTAKMVMMNLSGEVVSTKYERHNADVIKVVSGFLDEVRSGFGDCRLQFTVTGSVGMGLAERFGFPFIQEVIAATEYVRKQHSDISTIIDIGGEDAKIVYFTPDGNADLRMNGNCAGGTGAFIDQMAHLLSVDVGELDSLAANARQKHPIASRCGVFSKTDVQNLISKNVSKEDIAASIFHAVALQTIVTLSHGYRIEPKILFCGGPLTFIASLRKAFADYLELAPSDYIIPENGNLIPAWGAALSEDKSTPVAIGELQGVLNSDYGLDGLRLTNRLPAIFDSEQEYEEWKAAKSNNRVKVAPIAGHNGVAYLGIDSGSTTTKIVVTDDQDRILYSYYKPNGGNSIQAVREGLEALDSECRAAGVVLDIRGSYSTGYGEDLIKAAFNLNGGVIETIAHYVAARKINPNVSFILDIGGQDMKAIFVDHGVLSRMEINEACSSGCGSFIESFARSLNYKVEDFARMACLAQSPCDLGTRCTVFMNSKVKQVLREGATIGDIAAGLSYSVVKNCLYKVLKIKNAEELGGNIVVQGGTMRNDSVVRSLERLTGTTVGRSDLPELMGAYGCALYARTMADYSASASLAELLSMADYSSRQIYCRGCENSCMVNKYTFANDNVYYAGNKCEKVFSNKGGNFAKGRNMSAEKYDALFGCKANGAAVDCGSVAPDKDCREPEYAGKTGAKEVHSVASGELRCKGGADAYCETRGDSTANGACRRLTLGIPRSLNVYENYPFWNALLTECGIDVVLSDPSTFAGYEAGVHSVMSDNICFPAKLTHSHIYNLIGKNPDRIFMPFVVFEKLEGRGAANSYNCPVVTGYSEVVKSAINPAIPVDAPIITFKDAKGLEKQCVKYLAGLGVDRQTARRALSAALKVQSDYESGLRRRNEEAYEESRKAGKTTILLAGRPYHTDPLIQHKISSMISDLGATVITEDMVRGDDSTDVSEGAHIVSQWSYINRILRAAQWVAEQGGDVHFVQMTSFGCGPDAFLLDEVKDLLKRSGKSFTLLKIDDVNNIGSLKLRVRSVIESLRFGDAARKTAESFRSTKVFTKEERRRTLIAPFFTDYVSPLVTSAFKVAGYDIVSLPVSDNDSVEYGLKYANNEVCYPATLVIGDLLKALDSGKYDIDNTAVIITQTGGQCRASNYVAMLKRAMVEAGYEQVPVLSLAFGSGMINEQPGFTFNWLKFLPIALAAILFGDTLSKFYHASAVREKTKGDALRLREHYLAEASRIVARNDASALYALIPVAARDFNSIINSEELPKVGIVGEIYLKFNSFAHKNVSDWLIGRKIEVVPPMLTDFFMEGFVNTHTRHENHLKRSNIPLGLVDAAYSIVWRKMKKVNRLASEFNYYIPFTNIFEHAEHAKEVVSLANQFGEGWLLPAEVVSFAKNGINNVISLQPFGCIANHIVSKGVEKKIKTLYPRMNLLSLDFDGGVSDVNVTNRLMILANNLR